MANKAGYWRKNFSGDLAYDSFVPAPLPPNPVVELSNRGITALIQAHQAVAALNAVSNRVPSNKLFVSMYVRKEALLSSQIEGTQCTLDDLLDPFVEENINQDVDDVVNYIKAMNYAVERSKNFPLCNRFVREIHRELIGELRGADKLPGEFRSSQNWLGGQGSNIHNARYIPPNVEDMHIALANWENYIHVDDEIDDLVKVALLHYQFETIHPFLDGNGRVGRMFIILYLLERQVLSSPVLYISYYLKLNRTEYYDRMMQVRKTGDYEQWIIFFLEALKESAKGALETIDALDNLHKQSMAYILTMVPKRQLEHAGSIFTYLEAHPIIEIGKTAEALGMAYNSVSRVVKLFVEHGLLSVARHKGRTAIYVYSKYMDILRKDM